MNFRLNFVGFIFVVLGVWSYFSFLVRANSEHIFITNSGTRDDFDVAFHWRSLLSLVSNKYPQDPLDAFEWFSYVMYLGVIFGVLFLFGLMLSVTMCIVLCCQRCGRCGAKKGEFVSPSFRVKRFWFLIYAAFFTVFLTLTVLEIVYSAKLTENFYNATNSSKNSLSLFDNSLLQLKNDLENIVPEAENTTTQILNSLNDFPKSEVFNYSSQTRQQLNTTTETLSEVSADLDQAATLYTLLRDPLLYLETMQSTGKLTGTIPRAEELPNISSETNGELSSTQENMNSLSEELDSITNKVLYAASNWSVDVNSSFNSIVETVTTICNTLQDGVDASNKFNSTLTQFEDSFGLYNSIRLGIIIAFVISNVLLLSLWFLIFLTDKNRVLRVPIYTAIFFTVLFFLIGAVHLLIWNATSDFCEKHLEYLQQNSTQTALQNVIFPSNSSLPPQFTDFLLNTVLKNITALLFCEQNQTIFSIYNTNVDETFGLRSIVNESISAVRSVISDYSGFNETTNALITVNSLADNVTSLSTKVKGYIQNNTIAITELMNVYNQSFDLTRFGYNATSHAEKLSQLNSITTSCCNLTYDYNNATSINTTAPPYDTLDNNTKNQINMLSSEIGMMNQLKLIAETEQQRVQTAIINATTTYQNINQQLENVNYTLSVVLMNDIDSLKTVIVAIHNMTQSFIDNIYSNIDDAAQRILNSSQLDQTGNCEAVGNFYDDVIQDNVCSSFRLNVGVVAFTLLITGLLLSALFPIALITSRKLKKHPPKEAKLRRPLTKTNLDVGQEIHNKESGTSTMARSASAASGLASPSSHSPHAHNLKETPTSKSSPLNGPWEIELTSFEQSEETKNKDNKPQLNTSQIRPAVEQSQHLKRSIQLSKTPRSAREKTKTQMKESKSLLKVPTNTMKQSKSFLSNVVSSLFHSARTPTTRQTIINDEDVELSKDSESGNIHLEDNHDTEGDSSSSE